MLMSDLLEELEEMIRTPGVSGFEDDITELMKRKLKGLGSPYVDDLGNLILTVGKKDRDAKHVVVIAHMDELGLLVTNIDADGSLCIRKMGGIDDRTLVSRVVKISTRKGVVTGVIGIKPPHLMEDRSEMMKTVPWKELRVDIGTRSKKQSEAMGIELLDPMVLKKDFDVMNKKYVIARGMDDRFGCLVILEVLRRLAKAKKLDKLGIKLSFVWSVQEEIGLRGAFAVANRLQPDAVFAVDSGSSTDAPGMPKNINPFKMGEGPGLRLVDSRAVASPVLRRYIQKVAKKNKISLQVLATGGSTDAAAIQSIGCAAMPMCIPLRYTHSTVEVIHMDDLNDLIRLMVKILEGVGKELKGKG
jgi:putative aminopeptidase FrvX